MASNIYSFERSLKNQHILQDVMRTQYGFSNIENISSVNGVISVVFTTDITEQDRTTLSNIVFSFDDDAYATNQVYNIENIGIKLTTVNNTTWCIPCEFVAKGKYMDNIQKIGVNAYISSATADDTYDVRIYDAPRNVVCGFATFSNRIAETNEITIDEDKMPINLSPLEIQMKGSSVDTIVTVNSCCTFSIV